MIKVKRKVDGAVVEIREEDFDEELHEKIADARTLGDSSLADFGKAIADAVGAAMRTALEASGLGKVDRKDVVDPKDGDKKRDEPARYPDEVVAYGKAMRAVPAWERLYKSLPEAEQAYRTPEDDVTSWRFLRAMQDSDHTTLKQIRAEDPGIRAYNEVKRTIEGGAASGQDLLPTPLANIIIMKRDALERIQPRSLTVTSVSSTLSIPTENAVGAVAGAAESAVVGETESTFSEVTLTKKKAGRIVRASKEMLDDMSAAFSLVNILTNQAARKLAAYMDLQSAEDGDGVGTNHTDALIEASITTVAAVTGALTRAMLVDLILALPSEYRQGGGIHLMGNAATTGIISKIVDGNGRPIYLNATAPTQPAGDELSGPDVVSVVEGVRYLEVPFATNILIVGRLNEGFAVLMDAGIRVESSDTATVGGQSTFERDQVAWKFVERRDSAVVLTDAFRKSAGVHT